MPTTLQRINMDLPKSLWRLVSIRAAEEGTEKRLLVIKALEQYLQEKKEEE